MKAFVSVIVLLFFFFDFEGGTISNGLTPYCIVSNDSSLIHSDSIGSILPKKNFSSFKVIACGQSTHGSHENFLIQSSIFKYLVRLCNCKTFVLEANYSSIQVVNEYVSGEQVSKDSLVNALEFWPWKVDEMINLVDWIRKENTQRQYNSKIFFVGCDVQDLRGSVNSFYFDLVKSHFKDSTTIKKLLNPMIVDSNYYNDGFSYSSKAFIIAENNIKHIKMILNKSHFNYPGKSEIGSILEEHNLAIVEQSLFLASVNEDYSYSARDSLMAENVKWTVQNLSRGGPVFLWAHNDHVSIRRYKYKRIFPYRSLGACLSDEYHDKYFSILVDFLTGKFNAVRIKGSKMLNILRIVFKDSVHFSKPSPCEIKKISKQTLNFKIAMLHSKLVCLDLDSLRADTVLVKKLSRISAIHDVGALFISPSAFASTGEIDLRQGADLIIFFDFSTPTVLIERN